ncbi:MAG TPA: FxLYD domain-containing protein [Gammaproteobacteria bacterium]
METVKLILKKLFFGFLYGTGFMLGIWVAIFVFGNFTVPLGSKEIVTETQGARISQMASDLTIVSSKAIVRPYLIDVIGTLKNIGDAPARHTELVADLFDKDGSFIYQCKSWVSEEIQPGAESHFKIECHGITEEIYQGYKTYKVKVTRS